MLSNRSPSISPSQMNTDPEFFQRYSSYELKMGFSIYLAERQAKKNYINVQ